MNEVDTPFARRTPEGEAEFAAAKAALGEPLAPWWLFDLFFWSPEAYACRGHEWVEFPIARRDHTRAWRRMLTEACRHCFVLRCPHMGKPERRCSLAIGHQGMDHAPAPKKKEARIAP